MRPHSRGYRRRRARLTGWTAAAVALLLAVAALAFWLRAGSAQRRSAVAGDRPAGDRPAAGDRPGAGQGAGPAAPTYPSSGPGTWKYAAGQGTLMGTAGPVRRFRVAVESNVGTDPGAFAGKVDDALGDRRSWIAGGEFRLQQVPGNAPAEFTIYLATGQTTTRMCAAGGLNTGGYTSCRTAGHVIINLDRWTTSVPDYEKAGIPLDTYRTYVINHETGHEFGHAHELCPGDGAPAPVMQQQTLGLHGCTANPWPYPAGSAGPRYAGELGEYP
jgi:hypothetical protein